VWGIDAAPSAIKKAKEKAKSRVKKRSFNLPLLAKPYEPISSIRLSFGIVLLQEIEA
jgi:hypothetical protein